jgi:hypothetical protein
MTTKKHPGNIRLRKEENLVILREPATEESRSFAALRMTQRIFANFS